MENVDKVIDILCKTICEKNGEMSNQELIGLTKALANLIVARANVDVIKNSIVGSRNIHN